jgi:hypothetical protein
MVTSSFHIFIDNLVIAKGFIVFKVFYPFKDIIFNMYTSVKSCISYNNHTTGYFNCEIGVRQGENLSLFFSQRFLMI